jgi:hypothetical protein
MSNPESNPHSPLAEPAEPAESTSAPGTLSLEQIDAAWARAEAAQQDVSSTWAGNLLTQQRDLTAFVLEMLAGQDEDAAALGLHLLLVAVDAFQSAHPKLKRVRQPAILRGHAAAVQFLEELEAKADEDSPPEFREPILMELMLGVIGEATPESDPDQPNELRLQLLLAMLTVTEALHEGTRPGNSLPVMKRRRR